LTLDIFLHTIKMMGRIYKLQRGFTLIELMIVIVILGVLILVGVSGYKSSVVSSRDAKRKADIAKVQSALENYRNNQSLDGNYPSVINYTDLAPLLVPRYLNALPMDPHYVVPGDPNYTYTPLPASCAGTSNSRCTGYTLLATLDTQGSSGIPQIFAVNENGETLVDGAPLPTYAIPTRYVTPTLAFTPTPTPRNTPTITPTPLPPTATPTATRTPTPVPTPVPPTATPTPPACRINGINCSFNTDCCSGYCFQLTGKCAPQPTNTPTPTPPACINPGFCTNPLDCCSGYSCVASKCQSLGG
jgi:prepilin-type N-terminal cleavage/methylation domain-containing protein